MLTAAAGETAREDAVGVAVGCDSGSVEFDSADVVGVGVGRGWGAKLI